jgi:hypothetical protein
MANSATDHPWRGRVSVGAKNNPGKRVAIRVATAQVAVGHLGCPGKDAGIQIHHEATKQRSSTKQRQNHRAQAKTRIRSDDGMDAAGGMPMGRSGVLKSVFIRAHLWFLLCLAVCSSYCTWLLGRFVVNREYQELCWCSTPIA